MPVDAQSWASLVRLAAPGMAAAADGGTPAIGLTDERGSPQHNRLTGPQGELSPAQRRALIAHLRRLQSRLTADSEQASDLQAFIQVAERGPAAQ